MEHYELPSLKNRAADRNYQEKMLWKQQHVMNNWICAIFHKFKALIDLNTNFSLLSCQFGICCVLDTLLNFLKV